MSRTDQVEHWVESLVGRTAGQLRAELDVLVTQLQDAAAARVAERASPTEGPPGPTASAAGGSAPIDGRATARAVLEVIGALDAADSLSRVLDALADGAAGHAGRVLLVVQRGQALAGWRWHGYASNPQDAAMLEIPPNDDGLVARAARRGAVEKGSGPAAGHAALGTQGHARSALALPIAVDGRVVAVLYAEERDGGDDPDGSSPWAEVVEVLARHAARCLESMTARRLPELVHAAAAATAGREDESRVLQGAGSEQSEQGGGL